MNPIYEFLVEAMDCADRLAFADDSHWLGDAVNRAREAVELPDWLPQFCALVAAMSEPATTSRGPQNCQ